MKKITGACLISLLLLGCSSQGGESYPVIGFLKTNEHTITLQLGPNNQSLYTVRTHKGRLVADSLPESELVAKLPQLKTLIEEGMADGASLNLNDQGNVDGFIRAGFN
jgi:hypothetical protein